MRECVIRIKLGAWALVLGGLLAPRVAEAQCGAKHTSCSACHDGARAQAPSKEAWHENHAFADLCPTCHGGRGEANDLALAHAGLVAPLGSEERCASCHGAKARDLLLRYQPTSSGKADAGAPVATARTSPAPPATPPPRAGRAHGDRVPNLAMTTVVAGVGVLGLVLVVRRERSRRRPARPEVDAASPL